MDNTAAQRFDSTKFSERQPFRNFGAFEPPGITQQRSGSIAPNFLKKALQKFGAIEPPMFVVSTRNG